MTTLTTPPTEIADGISNMGRIIGTPRQVLVITVIATGFLALFATRGLPAWADAKGDGELAVMLDDLVERWANGLDHLNLTAPHDALRKIVRKLELARWE
jgi:hypothetical protein